MYGDSFDTRETKESKLPFPTYRQLGIKLNSSCKEIGELHTQDSDRAACCTLLESMTKLPAGCGIGLKVAAARLRTHSSLWFTLLGTEEGTLNSAKRRGVGGQRRDMLSNGKGKSQETLPPPPHLSKQTLQQKDCASNSLLTRA